MFKIFTENGDKIGNGHISRCLLLYNAIIQKGYEAIIYINGNENGQLLDNINYKLANWWDINCVKDLINKDDYVIIDSYHADFDVLNFISISSKNTLFFDDFDRFEYPEGIVFSPTLVNSKANVLSGEEYFLVRDAFYDFRKSKCAREIKKIFLSIGTDVNNVLDEIVRIVLEETSDIDINVITGKKFRNKRVKTHYNLDDNQMAELMSICDFSIIACGQTMLENLVIGNPFISLLTVDNQRRNYEFVKAKGLVDYLLDVRDLNFESNFRKVIRQKLNQENENFYSDTKLKDSRNAAEKIIDKLIKEK